MGYNDNLTGTWPTNYITQANKVGILDDVAIVASAAAKRGDVVVMLDDTLDTNIVTYDKDTDEFVEKQQGVSNSYTGGKTLLDDSFDGAFVEYTSFEGITQVRDAAAETLTWNVGEQKMNGSGSNATPAQNKPYDTLIIDKDTKVSHNAASLFDLKNHQGKVYYVKDGSKYYARFIEVKSYTRTSSDPTKVSEDGKKVTINKTTYNVAAGVDSEEVTTGNKKNSNYVLYFNDDDQLYKAVSDRTFEEKAYYVKSVGSASVRLVRGAGTTSTANMKDGDTLIWDGDEFIAPSELKPGDALLEITPDDLYVKIDEVTGELTKTTDGNTKATIGGKALFFNFNKNDETYAELSFINDEFESEGDIDDILGNNVKYILNKDNTIAAIIIDETSTGSKLYGIVVDADNATQTIASKTKSIVLFTQEGKTVTYDIDIDNPPEDYGTYLGKMVEYRLDKDGVIDKLDLVDGDDLGESLLDDDAYDNETAKVEVKNNAYLVGNTHTVTLASNVVIFEVSEDDGTVDPSLVTRASLLSGGDFRPGNLDTVNGAKDSSAGNNKLDKYAVYVTNSNGAAKALAYTNADSTNYHYGVISSYNFRDSDGDFRITFNGDDEVYDLHTTGSGTDEKPSYQNDATRPTGFNYTYNNVGNDALVIYTMTSGEVDIQLAIAKQTGLTLTGKEVKGFNDGLMTFGTDESEKGNMVVYDSKCDATTGHKGHNNPTGKGSSTFSEIMTDSSTIVYVMNASTGKFELGSLEDISKGAYVYVPVVDKDDIADIVIVDEWNH